MNAHNYCEFIFIIFFFLNVNNNNEVFLSHFPLNNIMENESSLTFLNKNKYLSRKSPGTDVLYKKRFQLWALACEHIAQYIIVRHIVLLIFLFHLLIPCKLEVLLLLPHICCKELKSMYTHSSMFQYNLKMENTEILNLIKVIMNYC